MPVSTPPSPEIQLMPQSHYDKKFADMDGRMDGFSNRLSGIEAGQAVMASSLNDTKANIAEVKMGIQQIFSRMDRDRADGDNRPSVVRTSTLLQIAALILGSSGLVSAFMYFWISPIKEDLTGFKKVVGEKFVAMDKASTERHNIQADQIERARDVADGLREQQLKDAYWQGKVDERMAGIRSDVDARKEDLRIYAADERMRIGDILAPIRENINRIDREGSEGLRDIITNIHGRETGGADQP